MNLTTGPLPLSAAPGPLAAPRMPGVALLGTGTVGSAFVHRYQRLRERGVAMPRLAWLANSRTVHACNHDPAAVLAEAGRASRGPASPSSWQSQVELLAGDVLVDATASDELGAQHAHWLARGVHVVTANKLGRGARLARAQAITRAGIEGGGRYGDSATVGAGLPVLASVRALVAGGDRIHAIEGVLSGSLAWLLGRHDGSVPFSECVRTARAAGYTEPDPRADLSGEDVRRKLLILARAAGMALEQDHVQVESLVPPALARVPVEDLDAALDQLDEPMLQRLQQARAVGARLCFVARLDQAGASVGLRALPPGHPLAAGEGTDNRVAIHSDRYAERPLLIQGPGAGAEVTAAALLDEVLRLLR